MAADKARADRGKELQAMFTAAEKLNPIKYQFAQQAARRVLEDDEQFCAFLCGRAGRRGCQRDPVCDGSARVIIGWSKKGAPGR